MNAQRPRNHSIACIRLAAPADPVFARERARRRWRVLATLGAAVVAPGSMAHAQESGATTQAAAPSAWSLGDATGIDDFLKPAKLVLSGYVETGITFNSTSPRDRQNFGRLFDDRSNEPLLNQASVILERAMETGGKFDWGGRVQFIEGSDSRFLHYTGELDNATNDIVQPSIIELFLTAHLPVLTEDGLDLKAGQFVTLMGAEVIDPRGNMLYSHSFVFNFGIPWGHTGALATIHLPAKLNLMLGVVTGINTGIDDNNHALSFHGGIGWASGDGTLSVSSALHIGPENPSNITAFDADKERRFITDTVVTWSVGERWQWMGEFVYGKDDGFDAEWYGAAAYLKCKLSDQVSLVGRAEVFRDDDGFAVVQFGDNDDAANAIRGLPVNDPRTVGGGATTYFALTAGINYKPCANVMIRPEVRWDFADVARGVSGGPFLDSRHTDQATLGLDLVVSY